MLVTRIMLKVLGNGNSLTITGAQGILRASWEVISGTCTFSGSAGSDVLTMNAGDANTISAFSAQAPLDGITIISQGTVNVEMAF